MYLKVVCASNVISHLRHQRMVGYYAYLSNHPSLILYCTSFKFGKKHFFKTYIKYFQLHLNLAMDELCLALSRLELQQNRLYKIIIIQVQKYKSCFRERIIIIK